MKWFRSISVARGSRPQIEMLPMIKTSQKRLLFFQFQFLLASSRTPVINNNIDPGSPGPLNLILPTNVNGLPTKIFKWLSIQMGPQQ